VADDFEKSYRSTLKLLENDPEDRDGLLSKCHTRCAQRFILRLWKEVARADGM